MTSPDEDPTEEPTPFEKIRAIVSQTLQLHCGTITLERSSTTDAVYSFEVDDQPLRLTIET